MKKLWKLSLVCLLGLLILSCGENKKEQEDPSLESASNLQEEKQAYGTASEQLSDSPRHHEWVSLSHGDRELEAFVVYPERDEKTKAIVVIHENRGLDDWARLFADKLAEEGYLVIAPDMISNTQGKKRTANFEDPDAARDAIYDLEPDQVIADLDAAYTYVKNDASSTGEVAVIGFCWGGSQTFAYATHNRDITSAHVFYGTAPDDPVALARIEAPVYGYYGGDDERVNATIERTEEQMKAANNKFEYEIYQGAGHAFMKRAHQPDASEANKEAHEQAWERLKEVLNQ